MDPLHLHITDFCRYADCQIDLGSLTGATLIVGRTRGNPKDANAVGKSTIFNAIKYALFNEIGVSQLDRIVRHGTKTARVSFSFVSSVDGETYRVIRSKTLKGGSDLRLARKQPESWEDLTQVRNSETERELARVLNINYRTFCNSVLFTQLDTTSLASLSPGDRKKILKEVLQLGVYSKYEALAKKRVSDIERSITENRVIVATVGNPTHDVTTLTEQMTALEADITIKTELLDRQLAAVTARQNSLTSIQTQIAEKEKQVAEYYTRKAALSSEAEKIERLTTQYFDRRTAVETEGKSISREIDTAKRLVAELTASNPDPATHLSAITIQQKDLLEKKAIAGSLSLRLNELRLPMPVEPVCRHCRQPITPESRADCQQALDIEIRTLDKELLIVMGDIRQVENQISSLIAARQVAEQALARVATYQRTIELKTQEIEAKRKLHGEYTDTLTRTSEQLMSIRQQISQLKAEVNDGSKEQFLRDTQQRDELARQITMAGREIEQTRGQLSQLSNQKAVLTERTAIRAKDILRLTDLHTTAVKLEADYTLHQEVVRAFGPGGIPALITHSVLDDLQHESNQFLHTFWPGLQMQFFVEKERTDGEVADTLGITFIEAGTEQEYAQLSGAQQILSSLALKLGLAQILKKRLGTDMRLLLIDEVDQSLAEAPMEAFERAIKSLQADYRILLITHSPELKTKFQRAIVVDMDETGVSSATVENNW